DSQLGFDLRYLGNAGAPWSGRSVLVSDPLPVPAAASSAAPTFGLLTVLPEEFIAMNTLIDKPTPWPVEGDRAQYVRGTVPSADPNRPHEVVLTMGESGNPAAAYAVANLIRSFPSVDQI